MRFLGYEEKLVKILEALYHDTISAVRVDGGLSDWFAYVVGVLQGWILLPLLFNIFLEVVMALVLDGNEIGADITGHCISNLHFADDISLMARSTGDVGE